MLRRVPTFDRKSCLLSIGLGMYADINVSVHPEETAVISAATSLLS